MKTFTTITNFDFYSTLQTDAKAGETDWSINKNTKAGDRVLLYVCAPVSSIVATAFIADAPYIDEDVNSPWFLTWFAKMENLKMLDHKITRLELKMTFPDWKYWSQPRNGIQVLPKYLTKLDELLRRKNETRMSVL